MRAPRRLDLLLVLQIAALAGCASIEKDSTAAARRIVIEAGGGVSARSNIQTAVDRLDIQKLQSADLGRWSSESVAMVHEAASDAAFYLNVAPERMVLLENKFLEEKLRRGPADAREVRRLYKGYLRVRLFDSARALATRFPAISFPTMPKEIVALSDAPRAVFAVGSDWRRVEQVAPPYIGSAIVVATFPGCPASEGAMEDLLADAATAKILRERGVLLTERFDAEGVSLWKKKFGLRSFYIVKRVADFPEFSFDASPTFYFLKDGVVKAHMTGWGGSAGPDGNRKLWLAEYERAAR